MTRTWPWRLAAALGILLAASCSDRPTADAYHPDPHDDAFQAVQGLEAQLDAVQQQAAVAMIKLVSNQLALYRLDVGAYPTTEQGLRALLSRPAEIPGWHGPYARDPSAFIDVWNHPLIYRNPSRRAGHDFDLCSYGAPRWSFSTTAPAMICNE